MMIRLMIPVLLWAGSCAWSLAITAPMSGLPIANEFIGVVVNRGPNETGRFSIRTTGGDPSRPASKNQHLIFGGDMPWTSYTTVLVDGEKYVFGGSTQRRAGLTAKYGQLVTPPTAVGNTITCTYRCGDIEVTQELAFARGPSTRMLDTLGITYRMTNHGVVNHLVGLRVLLDTMCGENDGAPIRAGSQTITSATVLSGTDVPDYWQAFDSLSKPSVISQGSLRGSGLTAPDKIIFADWGTLADEPWEPVITNDMGFIRKGETEPDTAAAMFWNPCALAPEKTVAYTTDYGIGDVSLKPGILTLGLTAPADATFEHERTDTFTITGYLQNAGGYEARDVQLHFALPAGLTLVSGSELSESYPSLKPDETAQVSWVVRPDGAFGGQAKLDIEVSSANIEANQITRTMQLNIPTPTLQMQPSAAYLPLMTNDLPTMLLVQVNLKPAESMAGARFTVNYDPKTIDLLDKPFGVTRGSVFVDDDRLMAWHYEVTGDGKVTVTGRRLNAAMITQAEANLATLKFQAIGAGKSTIQLTDAVTFNNKGEEHPLAATMQTITVTAEQAK